MDANRNMQSGQQEVAGLCKPEVHEDGWRKVDLWVLHCENLQYCDTPLRLLL